ncbi:hypothetical protein [Acidipropionibacterium acidipropionici]|uniref:hypothetical protein n=1 Tax=Acidipropionibacterium acidipropionici TaxID=1748 RepID=UPI000AFE299B|nr:hypothetical protein [Acidipropionibacterium acidipropionici]
MSDSRIDPDTTRALAVDRMRDVIVTIAVALAAGAIALTAGLVHACHLIESDDEGGFAR